MKYKALIDIKDGEERGSILYENDIFTVDSVIMPRWNRYPSVLISVEKKQLIVPSKNGDEKIDDVRLRPISITLDILEKFCKKV